MQYKELADYSKKNEFDVEKYLKHELVMSVDEEFEMYEFDGTDDELTIGDEKNWVK